MPLVGLFHGIIARNKRIEILNSYCLILKSKKIFGLQKVLGDKREKFLTNRSKIYLGVTIFLTTIHIIQIIDLLSTQKTITLFYIYKSFISVLCFINPLLNALQFLIDLNMQEVMMDAICYAVKNTIIEKSENDGNFTKWPVARRLRKLQRLFMSLIVGSNNYNNFSNPYLLIAFLVTIVMLIFNFYAIIILWLTWDDTVQHNQIFWQIMEFRTQCIVLSMCYALICCEDLLKPVSINYFVRKCFPLSLISKNGKFLYNDNVSKVDASFRNRV